MTTAKHAHGTQLQMSDGDTPAVFTTIAQITNITGPNVVMDTVDVTTMDSVGGWKEFIAGMLDGGEIGVEAFLVADVTQLEQLARVAETDADERIKPYRIVVPDDTDTKTATVSGTTWTTATHNWNSAQPVRFTTTGALPVQVIPGRIYFARRLSGTTFSIHATAADAVAGTNAINSGSAGTGTHTAKSGTTFTFNAMTTVFQSGAPKDGALSLNLTLKVTGPVTTN